MTQMQRIEVESVTKETTEKQGLDGGGGGSSGPQVSAFKFNAQAWEFVPRSHTTASSPAQISPISCYFYPCFHCGGCGNGVCSGGGTGVGSHSSDWIYVGGGEHPQHQQLHDSTGAFFVSNPTVHFTMNQPSSSSKNLLSDDLRLKMVKQVEYQFTDLSLSANECISKHTNKASGTILFPAKQEEVSSLRKRKRKKLVKSAEKRKRRGGSGFTQVCRLSPEFQAFTGVTVLARTEVVKMLWSYIKENNLQDPNDKRTIICDASLRSLFSLDSINMFQMSKQLTKHIWPLDDNAGESVSSKSPKKGKQKMESTEGRKSDMILLRSSL